MILDLFAGPGGWDTGVREAGYTGPLVGIEHDLDACRTAVAAGHERVCADVATYPLERFGWVDGLIASPPCQSFSSAGKRLGLADPRGLLSSEPLRWARALMPRWVACEQVPEVLPIWRQTAHELRALGYSTWAGLLLAADYGVPQTRLRAFLIARRDGIPAGPPAATHSEQGGEGLFGSVLPWVSMADALGWGLPDELCPTVMTARGRQAGPSDVLRGSSWRAEWWQRQLSVGNWVMAAAVATSEESAGTVPRSLDEPSATITGKGTVAWVYDRPATTVCGDPRIGRPGHKDRETGEAQFDSGSVRVTVAEAGVLQGFAADYPWRGTKTAQYSQVGNAVCPPLAAAIIAPLLADASERAA